MKNGNKQPYGSQLISKRWRNTTIEMSEQELSKSIAEFCVKSSKTLKKMKCGSWDHTGKDCTKLPKYLEIGLTKYKYLTDGISTTIGIQYI